MSFSDSDENQSQSFISKAGLDCAAARLDNRGMNLRGRVRNGVVVLDNPSELPEGAVVDIYYPVAPVVEAAHPGRRIHLPLVTSRQPGTKLLTSERVAELLEDDDDSA
jgi:hypothetical protein